MELCIRVSAPSDLGGGGGGEGVGTVIFIAERYCRRYKARE